MPATSERAYASYRGLMSDGAPIGCIDCRAEGRTGVLMTYKGIEKVSQLEGVPADRTLDTLPYDVWVCPFGHRNYDGY